MLGELVLALLSVVNFGLGVLILLTSTRPCTRSKPGSVGSSPRSSSSARRSLLSCGRTA
jgi:hypothetical protein